MRVLMLSWEYPPHLVGGIATHVEGLAAALARAGHDVVVCTPAAPGSDDADESVGGVRVLRADVGLPWLPDDEFVARAIAVNHHLVRITSMLGSWTPEVVHAHDWLTAWAADTLRALHHVPMVATVHATERGRHGGHLPEGLPGTVNSAEWWLTYQARSVIACSRYMVREVIDAQAGLDCRLAQRAVCRARYPRRGTRALRARIVSDLGIAEPGRAHQRYSTRWASVGLASHAIKRADPGKLDTLAAGGVLAGESFRRCAIRELWEEAGVTRTLAREIDFPGVIIRSLREATFGIHDQQVIVADLLLDENFEPVGRDGEVEEFLCLEPDAIRAALDGGEFTVEAALATRECLERRGL